MFSLINFSFREAFSDLKEVLLSSKSSVSFNRHSIHMCVLFKN